MGLKITEIQKFSPKNIRFWGNLSVFRGVIFARKEKKVFKKMSRLTDPTWKVRRPVKKGFFFSWPDAFF